MLCLLTGLVDAQECTCRRWVELPCNAREWAVQQDDDRALEWFSASPVPEHWSLASFGFRHFSLALCLSCPRPSDIAPDINRCFPRAFSVEPSVAVLCQASPRTKQSRQNYYTATLYHSHHLLPRLSSSKSFLTHFPAVQHAASLRSNRPSIPHPTSQPGGEVCPSASHSTPFGHNKRLNAPLASRPQPPTAAPAQVYC